MSYKPALPHIYLYVAGGLFSWLFYRQLAAAWWLPACGGMQRRGGWLWLAVVYLKQWSNLLQPHASNCWNHACQTRIEISAEYRVVIGKACFCSSTQWPPKSRENLMFVCLQIMLWRHNVTSQFTPKMKANAKARLLSSLLWIDQKRRDLHTRRRRSKPQD